MAKIVVKSVDDARFVAAYFGMQVSNEGSRGAFPIVQLERYLRTFDHELDRSEYQPSNEVQRNDPIYRVRTLVKINGKGQSIAPAYAEIALSEVRERTGKRGRGRPGKDAIVAAVVDREKWRPVDNRLEAFDVQ